MISSTQIYKKSNSDDDDDALLMQWKLARAEAVQEGRCLLGVRQWQVLLLQQPLRLCVYSYSNLL